jgi:hypothetical protein
MTSKIDKHLNKIIRIKYGSEERAILYPLVRHFINKKGKKKINELDQKEKLILLKLIED